MEPRTYWLTGLPSSGKTTAADALADLLRREGVPVLRIDGDALRAGLCSDLDLSPVGRAENIRRAGETALVAASSGVVAVVSLISPMRADRDAVRARHVLHGIPFHEIWMNTSPEVCASRDPKGLWEKAALGTIKGLTGFDAPYEPPKSPDLVLGPDSPPETMAEAMLALVEPVGSYPATRPVPPIRPVFLHHPMKCGGRALSASIRQACIDLAGVSGLDGRLFHDLANSGSILRVGPWIANGPDQNFPFRATHYPAHTVKPPAGWLRVTTLRDPLARLVSLFRMYVAEHPRHAWWSLYDQNRVPPPKPVWREFVEKAPKGIVNHQTLMFSAGVNPVEAADRIRELDLWWRSDRDASEALSRLAALMGLPFIPDIRHGEALKDPPAETVLSDNAAMAVALERLAPDIALLRLLEER
jgi:bifunctional enzyme CysN/CysC